MRRRNENLILKVIGKKLAGNSFIIPDFPRDHKLGDLVLEVELLGVQKP